MGNPDEPLALTPRPKPKYTKAQLTRNVKAFLYSSLQDIPFTMNLKDIKKRDELRREKLFFTIGGLGGINLAGYYFSRKKPQYRIPIVAASGIFSLGTYLLGDYLVVLDASRYLKKKFNFHQKKPFKKPRDTQQKSKQPKSP